MPAFPPSGLIEFPEFGDARGKLVVLEFEKLIPFAVKRSFLVHGVPAGNLRGEHAHRACHQLLLCVAGSMKALADDGKTKQIFDLSNPRSGLYLPPMTWGGQFDHSHDAKLIVFASHEYSAEDYISDYNDFLDLLQEKQ